MKGGKQGRKRTTSSSDTRPEGKRGKPRKPGEKKPGAEAPKKGTRKKSFGWSSTTEE
jgi:hypothetical protein